MAEKVKNQVSDSFSRHTLPESIKLSTAPNITSEITSIQTGNVVKNSKRHYVSKDERLVYEPSETQVWSLLTIFLPPCDFINRLELDYNPAQILWYLRFRSPDLFKRLRNLINAVEGRLNRPKNH